MRNWTKTFISSLLGAALALPVVSLGQNAGDAVPPVPPTAPAPPAPAAQDQDQTVTITTGDGNVALLRAQGVADQAKAELERAMVARNGAVWAARGGKKEKAAFLGVVAVQADPALRSQLKLPRGIGLVINQVNDNTPAAAAGIQEHDIFTKLDDQWLVTSQQLGVLIRMHKAGDEITLTGMREGQPLTIKAKLEEKEMIISDNGDQLMAPWGVAVPAQLDFQNLANLGNLGNLVVDGDDAALVIKDDEQTLKVSVKDGERHLVATDANDNVVFDGPVETEDQRKSLPADLSEKLEKYKEQFDQVKDSGPGNTHKIRIINKNK